MFSLFFEHEDFAFVWWKEIGKRNDDDDDNDNGDDDGLREFLWKLRAAAGMN